MLKCLESINSSKILKLESFLLQNGLEIVFFEKEYDIQNLFNNEHFPIFFDDICNNKHLSYDTLKKM